jgi:hypothetical protein
VALSTAPAVGVEKFQRGLFSIITSDSAFEYLMYWLQFRNPFKNEAEGSVVAPTIARINGIISYSQWLGIEVRPRPQQLTGRDPRRDPLLGRLWLINKRTIAIVQ